MNSPFNCLLCKNTGSVELVSDIIRDIQPSKYSVQRCLCCGHVQITPLPSEDEIKKFYQQDQQTYNVHNGEVDLHDLQNKSFDDTLRRIAWLKKSLPVDRKTTFRLLDVGCRYGFFVDAAFQNGYDATGVDVGTKRLELARNHMQGKFIEGEISDLLKQKYEKRFDVITLFHVLEHIADPVSFLVSSFDLLVPGGFLLVEVPNLDDHMLTNKSYERWFWQFAHLSYFDRARLSLTFKRAGFKRFRITGVQRYGLRNHLNWIDFGKPQINNPVYSESEGQVMFVDSLYRSELERRCICDTLTAEVKK